MITKDGKPYREFRCIGINCRALLALEYIYAGRLSIVCPKCNFLNTIDFKAPKNVILKEVSNYQLPNLKGGENK